MNDKTKEWIRVLLEDLHGYPNEDRKQCTCGTLDPKHDCCRKERVEVTLSKIVEAVKDSEAHYQSEIYPMGTTGNFTDRMGNTYEKK